MKMKWLALGMIAAMLDVSNASQITLDPGSLPSTQGWDYRAVNYHAGVVETDIFSTDGSVLTMNSMSEPISGVPGGSITYRQYDVIEAAMPTTLEWTSRTLEYETLGNYHGFSVGFSDGSLTYAAGISLNDVAVFDGGGWEHIAIDATEYHTYRIETITGTADYSFYIDDVLEASVSARSVAGNNYLSFGDGTCAANARADITALQFTQIPEPATMGLIGIFAGGIVFIRRFFIC